MDDDPLPTGSWPTLPFSKRSLSSGWSSACPKTGPVISDSDCCSATSGRRGERATLVL